MPQLQPQRRTLYSPRLQSWVRQVATRDCSFLTAFFFFPFIQQESGLPGSKQGDSHPSPLCRATSRVLVEHPVDISIAARTSTVLRHLRSKTTNTPVVSDACITTRACLVFHHPISFRRHQRTNVSIAPVRYLEIQLELSKTAPQAPAFSTTSPTPPYQILPALLKKSRSFTAGLRLKTHQQSRRYTPYQQGLQTMALPGPIVAIAM